MNPNTARLTVLNTILYALQGIKTGGWQEANRRLWYFWPLHLHKWFGWYYRKPVVRYYGKKCIAPVGGLKCDISSDNRHALFYYAYAIRHLSQIDGVEALLEELATIDRAPDEDVSHDGERRYHNLMVELHGCYFVHKCLGMKVADVEYQNHKVHSPNRIGSKSCDIKGSSANGALFFECKDSSAEILSGTPYGEFFITSPRNDSENRLWLFDRVQDADDKGADYLVAKIPIWSEHSGTKRIRTWMSSVFPEAKWKKKYYFNLTIPESKYRCIRGMFILMRKTAIRIEFVRMTSRNP